MNPDIQEGNNNITYSGFEETPQKEEDGDEDYNDYNYDEDDMMDEDIENIDIINDSDYYKPYNFENTIDKIFKTEKRPKNTGENDPRRFEDA